MTIVHDAVFLCKSDTFHKWLERREYYIWGTVDEKQARNIVCELCGIKSRAELANNDEAAAKFRKLEQTFRTSASKAYAA